MAAVALFLLTGLLTAVFAPLSLAQSERITDPKEIAPAVARAVASGKPAVLDIVIDGSL